MNEEEAHFVEVARTSLAIEGPVYEFVAPDAAFVPSRINPRPYFAGLRYVACSVDGGCGVDEERAPNHTNLPDACAGAVLLLGVLEHSTFPGLVFQDVHRVLRSNGWAIVSTRMRQPIHGPCSDYWRFTPQGLELLFKHWFGSYRVWACGRPRFPRTVVGVATPAKIDDEALKKLDARMGAWESHWGMSDGGHGGAVEARDPSGGD